MILSGKSHWKYWETYIIYTIHIDIERPSNLINEIYTSFITSIYGSMYVIHRGFILLAIVALSLYWSCGCLFNFSLHLKISLNLSSYFRSLNKRRKKGEAFFFSTSKRSKQSNIIQNVPSFQKDMCCVCQPYMYQKSLYKFHSFLMVFDKF